MIGNDDCGQMSAWYILSTLGFYPVNPAGNEFVLGAPQIKKATIHINGGKYFTISAKNISNENIYVEKTFLNKKLVENPFITYDQIMNGGNLVVEMTGSDK
jgi:putative alpha-1,2-mannosidase